MTGYHVKETDNGDGTYTYELEADPAVLIRATPDNGAATEYTDPADIDTAFALVKSGGTVDILGAVNGLTAGVTVDAGKTVTVTGATTNALDLNGQKITLGEGSKLTIDKKLDKDADFTAVTGYHVKETDNGDGTYTYELEADEVPATPIIELYDDSNALVNTYYKASDIVTAFGAAKDGYTIKLLANVTLSDDVTIKAGDTVTLDVNGNTFTVASGKTITLQRDGAKKATLRSNQSLDASTQLAKKYADGSDDVYSEITSTADGAYTAYTLKALTPKTSISDIYTTNGKVSADNTNKIVSALFSNDTKLIILDVVDPVSLNKTIEGAQHAGNGITPLEFRVQVVYSDENVESKDIACTKADGTAIDNTKCIPTGAKVTITATNPDYTADNGGSSATYTYTVVVLGDTDCDGIISNADNVLMQNYYIDKEGKGLSGYALIAANVNRDSDTTMNSGSVDNNDKVQNLIKYWRPWDYKTHLTTSSAS